MNWVKFLGTGGGRVVVFRQLRQSGGMWLKMDGVNILIDPGPGSLIRIFENGLEPRDLNIVILSHRHLDHSSDINAVLESATESTKNPIDLLIAPKDALEGEEPVLLKYLRKGIKEVVYLDESTDKTYQDLQIKGVIKHIHRGANTYGLQIKSDNSSFVYVPCGRFFDEMLTAYPQNPDVMIFNTTFVKPRKNVQHLSAEDVKKMVSHLKPKKAVLTHFSVEMLKANPKQIAADIHKDTGIPTIAAEDNMKLNF